MAVVAGAIVGDVSYNQCVVPGFCSLLGARPSHASAPLARWLLHPGGAHIGPPVSRSRPRPRHVGLQHKRKVSPRQLMHIAPTQNISRQRLICVRPRTVGAGESRQLRGGSTFAGLASERDSAGSSPTSCEARFGASCRSGARRVIDLRSRRAAGCGPLAPAQPPARIDGLLGGAARLAVGRQASNHQMVHQRAACPPTRSRCGPPACTSRRAAGARGLRRHHI